MGTPPDSKSSVTDAENKNPSHTASGSKNVAASTTFVNTKPMASEERMGQIPDPVMVSHASILKRQTNITQAVATPRNSPWEAPPDGKKPQRTLIFASFSAITGWF
jgi:hypothetical protein